MPETRTPVKLSNITVLENNRGMTLEVVDDKGRTLLFAGRCMTPEEAVAQYGE